MLDGWINARAFSSHQSRQEAADAGECRDDSHRCLRRRKMTLLRHLRREQARRNRGTGTGTGTGSDDSSDEDEQDWLLQEALHHKTLKTVKLKDLVRQSNSNDTCPSMLLLRESEPTHLGTDVETSVELKTANKDLSQQPKKALSFADQHGYQLTEECVYLAHEAPELCSPRYAEMRKQRAQEWALSSTEEADLYVVVWSVVSWSFLGCVLLGYLHK